MDRTRIIGNGIQRLHQWVKGSARAAEYFGFGESEPASPVRRRNRLSQPGPGAQFRAIEPLEPRTLLTVTIFSETFENSFPATGGWMVEDANAVGTPAYWGAVDAAFGGQGTHGGSSKGYVAGVGFEGSPENPQYVNSMSSRMSRSIDLTEYSAASIEFWYKIPSIDAGLDHARLYIDSTVVWELSAQAPDWTLQTIDLQAYLGGAHTLIFEFQSGSSGVAEGLYLDDIQVAGEPVDPDPDDTTDQAIDLGSIPLDGELTVEGLSINVPTDVDMFAITVSAGQTLGFRAERTEDSLLRFHIRLFDAWGNELAYNSFLEPHQYNNTAYFDSHLDYRFSNGGTYYLGVSSYANNSYLPTSGGNDIATVGNNSAGNAIGDYRLIIDSANDPDDTISEAHDLGVFPPGGVITLADQELTRRTDVDMVAFTVAAGQKLYFETIELFGPLSPELIIFNSQGVVLYAIDEGNSNPLDYTFVDSGTYYLGISVHSNQDYNPITGRGDNPSSNGGSYTLMIYDDDDDNDTIGEAIDIGEIPTEGILSITDQRLLPRADVNMYSFSVAAGRTIGFDLDRDARSSYKSSSLRLFDAAGTELAYNFVASGPIPELHEYESYVEYTFETAGIYYLGVAGIYNAYYDPVNGNSHGTDRESVGVYHLHIGPVIDIDDAIAEAVDLGVIPMSGSIVTGDLIIDRSTDVDMFAFTVVAGQTVGFDIDEVDLEDQVTNESTDGFYTHLRLFDADGIELDFNSAGFGFTPEGPDYVFSFINHLFTTDGTYYLGVSSRGNENYNPMTGGGDQYGNGNGALSRLGGYRLHIETTTDLDDTINEAHDLGMIAPGGALSFTGQSIDIGSDVDMVAFFVTAGRTLGFDVDRHTSSLLTSRIRLFDSQGNELAGNRGGIGPGPETNGGSFLNFTFFNEGMYYLGVSNESNSTYDPVTGGGDTSGYSVGGYDLFITDMTDTGDRISQAIDLGAILVGGLVSSTGQMIDPGWNVDMFAFTVAIGQSLGFDIDRPLTGQLNSYLRLFDPTGAQLAFNDNQAGPSPEYSTDEAYLEFTFVSAGTYYIGVSNRYNTKYSATNGDGDSGASGADSMGVYNLRIVDVTDFNDSIAESINLGPVPITGESIFLTDQFIGRFTDVNMVAFSVLAGQKIGFDIDRPSSSSLDSYIRLFDSTGSALAANDNGIGPSSELSNRESYLEYSFTTDGIYYLGISSIGNTNYNPSTGADDILGQTTGGYDLTVTSYADFDNTIINPFNLGWIPAGGSIARTGQAMDFGSDVDMVSFIASAGQAIGFDIDITSGASLYSPIQLFNILRLFDADGVEIAFNARGYGPIPEYSNREAYLEYTFDIDGTYFLGVSASGNIGYHPVTGAGGTSNFVSSNYTLTIFDRTDLDDTLGDAFDLGPIPADGVVAHTNQFIEFHDVDMVSFDVIAGQTIGFDLDRTPGSLLESFFRIFDSSGRELASISAALGPLPETGYFNSYIEYTFPTSGKYYLGISAYGNMSYDPITGDGDGDGASTGGYDLFIMTRIDPDDAISEAVDIGVIPAAGSITRLGQMIDLGTDVDMIAFTVSAGQTIAFDLDRDLNSALTSHLRLFDGFGVQLTYNAIGFGPLPEIWGESFIEHTFSVAGTYYLGISSSYNDAYNPISGAGDYPGNSIGGYILTITDRIDPDDTISEAFDLGVIPTETLVVRSGQTIDFGTDVDMVGFTVISGQTIGFGIQRTPDSLLNTDLVLFNSTGAVLRTYDSGAGHSPEFYGVVSYLFYTFTADGKYYLGISSAGNAWYDPITGTGDFSAEPTGGYNLLVKEHNDHDDAIAEAAHLGLIPLGGSVFVSGQTIDNYDVDMFEFTVMAGQTIAFDVDLTMNSNLNSYIRLFDADGSQLAVNDNGVGPSHQSYTTESYLEYTFSVGGTYYLGVSDNRNIAYNPINGTQDSAGVSLGGYDLLIFDIPNDPDDTIAEAVELGSVPLSGSVSHTGQSIDFKDVDIVAFMAIAGQTFAFDIDLSLGSQLDSYIRLFTANGTLLKSNNNSTGPAPEFTSLESYFKHTFLIAGTYFLAVSSNGNTNYNPATGQGKTSGNSVGAYDLIITDTYPDPNPPIGPGPDPDDTLAEPTHLGLIPTNASVSRINQSISDVIDVDMIAFTVIAGQTLGFDLDRSPGSGLNGYLRLFNASGVTLAFNDIGAGPFPESSIFDPYFEYTFAVAGTYYLGVSSKGNEVYNPLTGNDDHFGSTTGGYDLHISSINDADGTIGQAIPLGPIPAGGGAETGVATIDRGGDVNFYSFTVSAGQTLDIDLDATVGSNLASYLRLFDASGNLLATGDFAPGPLPETTAFESYLRHTFATGGTYYLGVSGYGNDTYHPITGAGGGSGILIGGYSLQITDSNLAGDFNRDGSLDAGDITLIQTLAAGGQYDSLYDLNRDGQITAADVDSLIRDHLHTEYGDADLNGQVSLGDLVILAENFDQPGGWAQGDFTGDGMVSLGDLVLLAANFTSSTPDPLSGEGDAADQSGDAGGNPDMLRQSPALEEEDKAEEDSPFADILAELAAGLRD